MPNGVTKYCEGSLVWASSRESGFLCRRVERILGNKVVLSAAGDLPNESGLSLPNFFNIPSRISDKQITDPPDLYPYCQLDSTYVDNAQIWQLSPPLLLENIRLRFLQRQVYTWTYSVLFAVNPWRFLESVYDNASKRAVYESAAHDLPPHPYSVAEKIRRFKRGEHSLIISGDSGAGKTETAKHVIDYLDWSSGASGSGSLTRSVVGKLRYVNPVLEALGNASTPNNWNSSRYAKLTTLCYSNQTLSSVSVASSLLEISRVTNKPESESCFHIFYVLLAGLKSLAKKDLADPGRPNDDAVTQLFNLPSYAADHYNFLQARRDSKSLNEHQNLLDTFAELQQAFPALNISRNETASIYCVLASIICLGNVDHQEALKAVNSMKSHSIYIEAAASLLSISISDLAFFLHHKILPDLTVIKRTCRSAIRMRNVLCQKLYTRIFECLVTLINKDLDREDKEKIDKKVHIFDFSGFETLERNSLDQLLINFSNDNIKQIFFREVLCMEREAFRYEGILPSTTEDPDVTPIISSVSGIFRLLGDQSLKVARSLSEAESIVEKEGDQKFFDHLEEFSSRPPVSKVINCKFQLHYGQASKFAEKKTFFTVRHSVGHVTYTINGWVGQNVHENVAEIEHLFISSKNLNVRNLADCSMPQTVGTRFVARSTNFCSDLSRVCAQLTSSKLSFIHCIKPNEKCDPDLFHSGLVSSQLRYSGAYFMTDMRRLWLKHPRKVSFKSILAQTMICRSSKKQFDDLIRISSVHLLVSSILICLQIDVCHFLVGRNSVFLDDEGCCELERQILGLTENGDLSFSKFIAELRSTVFKRVCRRLFLASRFVIFVTRRVRRRVFLISELQRMGRELQHFNRKAIFKELSETKTGFCHLYLNSPWSWKLFSCSLWDGISFRKFGIKNDKSGQDSLSDVLILTEFNGNGKMTENNNNIKYLKVPLSGRSLDTSCSQPSTAGTVNSDQPENRSSSHKYYEVDMNQSKTCSWQSLILYESAMAPHFRAAPVREKIKFMFSGPGNDKIRMASPHFWCLLDDWSWVHCELRVSSAAVSDIHLLSLWKQDGEWASQILTDDGDSPMVVCGTVIYSKGVKYIVMLVLFNSKNKSSVLKLICLSDQQLYCRPFDSKFIQALDLKKNSIGSAVSSLFHCFGLSSNPGFVVIGPDVFDLYYFDSDNLLHIHQENVLRGILGPWITTSFIPATNETDLDKFIVGNHCGDVVMCTCSSDGTVDVEEVRISRSVDPIQNGIEQMSISAWESFIPIDFSAHSEGRLSIVMDSLFDIDLSEKDFFEERDRKYWLGITRAGSVQLFEETRITKPVHGMNERAKIEWKILKQLDIRTMLSESASSMPWIAATRPLKLANQVLAVFDYRKLGLALLDLDLEEIVAFLRA